MALPDFTRLPGDIVGAPPYRADGCLMQAMSLTGDRGLLQDYVDKALNRPSGGRCVFHAPTDQVMLSALYVTTMRSLDAIDSQRGVMKECDVGFWILVFGGPRGHELDWKAYWLPTFLYVDSASAMASGREIYGYPKTAGRFVQEPSSPEDPTVEIHALHMPEYGPTKRPADELVLQITASPTPAPKGPPGEADLAAAWSRFGVDAGRAKALRLPPSLTTMPQIMLRQFRDPFQMGRASLMQGLVAPIRSIDVHDQGFLKKGVLELTASASHSIVQTLGVDASSEVDGFWIEQDFQIDSAQLLWTG